MYLAIFVLATFMNIAVGFTSQCKLYKFACHLVPLLPDENTVPAEIVDLNRGPSPLRELSPGEEFSKLGNAMLEVGELILAAKEKSAGKKSSGRRTFGTSIDNHCETQPASASIDQMTPLKAAGHFVSVTIHFEELQPATGCAGKAKMKKASETKSDHVNLEEISRSEAMCAFLAIHDLNGVYDIHSERGPPFKMCGGKTDAPIISTNKNFSVLVSELFKKTKLVNIRTLEDGVIAGDGEELVHGTKVPRLENFSDATQLHRSLLLKLKKLWQCQTHLGEHGQPGHCFVSESGKHLGLNNRHFNLWTAAIAAGKCMIYDPPSISEFDGLRDGS
ncbi:hypothetical protein BD410DRAFT_801984 [Rickenella mellea]|uniref:Fungal-type protein kinase domain-containing protein n=1 Tax=Rickenella mellea TaxID=50990 RepID=A0A4Y7QCU8_9AGAM|nr:hypothetical protein BD410DRAFT_801984 [Rickenella mellea]